MPASKPPTPSPADLIQQEVIGNIVNQPLGAGTVADLNLPREFLVRVADRIIRASFNERRRIVVSDSSGASPASAARSAPRSSPASSGGGGRVFEAGGGEGVANVRVVDRAIALDVREARQGLPNARPALRSFRSETDVDGRLRSSLDLPGDQRCAEIARRVASRLARDGLLATARHALMALGLRVDPPYSSGALEQLHSVGVPTDLLGFTTSNEPARADVDPGTPTRTFADSGPASGGDVGARLGGSEGAPSNSNFRLLPDDGTHRPRALRLQLTRGTDYAAPGDGGSLDMLRAIAGALPDMPLVVRVERRHFPEARAACGAFARGRAAPITLVVEDVPLAQWAHDNGKPGMVGDRAVTVVPRYASRGEGGSVFVPGESFVGEGLEAAGYEVRRSGLLFQGGNLLAFRRPGRGSRVLLLGEAEVHRNTALGLSRDEVLSAFKSEFGVDEIGVVPAISYHLDLEVSIRSAGSGSAVAFVNDSPAAARIVVGIGIDALERAGHVTPKAARVLRDQVRHGPMNSLLSGAWEVLARHSRAPGHVSESLTPAFAVGESDSGVGNVLRFMQALDLLASELPLPKGIGAHAAAMLGSLARRESERRRLRVQLQSLGLRVVAVPSLSDGDRSLNSLNGIHLPDAYLMPIYGGLFEPLDRAAAGAIRAALGDEVLIIPIPSGESQRREGAVRCAVAGL